MKKVFLAVAAIAITLAFASCEKTCVCNSASTGEEMYGAGWEDLDNYTEEQCAALDEVGQIAGTFGCSMQ